MNAQAFHLGIDLGTGSCKTAAINRGGEVLGFGAADYPSQGRDARWQEQHPDALVEGMIAAVRAAIQHTALPPENCAGLSLGGALHNIMALDANHRPLTGVITWADTRAAAQAEAVRRSNQAAEMVHNTGCPPHNIYGLYKLLWLREEKTEIFKQAARFLSGKEYVFHALTGQFWTDHALASGNALLNTHSLKYDPTALSLAGIEVDQLSQLLPAETVHHGISPNLAARMGLSPDIPVTLGASDAANSSLGAGAVHPGQATLSVGTSGAFRIVSPQPLLDEAARSWCYSLDQSHWLVGGAVNNAGIALAWWRDALNQTLPEDRQLSFDNIIDLAAQTEPGADGLICLPYLTGERTPHWNQHARGVLFGLGLEHGTRHLSRAVLEGVAFSFRSLANVIADLGVEVDEVRASGGITHSPLWLQLMADVLGQPISLPAWGETAALGAAFWALLTAGEIDAITDAADLVELGPTFQPNPAHQTLYREGHKKFERLYQALESSFES